jgi:hypothetical protein
MTNDRKKWLCPSCPHRSSRKGNMKLHIQRWHKEGEPLCMDDLTVSLLKGKTNFGKSIVPSILLLPFYANPLYSSSTLVSPSINSQDTKREEIAGFKAKICQKYMEIVIETQYAVEY